MINGILEIYKVWPVCLALKAHVFVTEASISLRRVNLTKARKEHKIRQKAAVVDCMHANIHGLTALFMMSWEMVREQAEVWGVNMYTNHRKI